MPCDALLKIGGDFKHFSSVTSTQNDVPMLICIPQEMQSPEMGGLIGVPTMVWLKRLHDGDCFFGNAESGFRNFDLCVKSILSLDRETDVSSGFQRRNLEHSQVPSYVIKRGSEITDEVACDRSDTKEVIFVKSLIPDNEMAAYRIVIARDSLVLLGSGANGANRRTESIKVSLRPYHFQVGRQGTFRHNAQIIPK